MAVNAKFILKNQTKGLNIELNRSFSWVSIKLDGFNQEVFLQGWDAESLINEIDNCYFKAKMVTEQQAANFVVSVNGYLDLIED
jgi:hypothetical protein